MQDTLEHVLESHNISLDHIVVYETETNKELGKVLKKVKTLAVDPVIVKLLIDTIMNLVLNLIYMRKNGQKALSTQSLSREGTTQV